MLITRTDFLTGTIDYPDLTTATLPATAARLYGERNAFVFGDRALTYAEFGTQSGRFAAALRAQGIGRGDIVLMHMANGIEFVVAYYGTLRSGATVSLVNPLQPAEGLHSQLVDTAARAVVTQAAQAPVALAAIAETAVELVIIDAPGGLGQVDATAIEFWDFTRSASEEYTCADLGGDDIAHVSYTGGTTGVPKGVRVLHRNVLANVAQMMMARTGRQILRRADGQFGFSADVRPGSWEMGLGEDVGIVVSPLFHVHALILLNTSLLSGVTSVFTGRFAPAAMLELIERYRVTAISGSPAMWHALAAHPDARTRDLSSVRVITSGAAPLDLPTAGSLRAMFQSALVGEGYGMTEATAVVTVPPMTGRYPFKDGSVGVPLFDTEVQVRALDGSGAVLAANERGTLWVHGPQVADGYLNKPAATAQQFVDGWLDTGDVGHVDEDGFVFISDRIKDMLLYKGYNVYPREIEDILVTHPAVDTAAVVGRPSPEAGEEPVGFVVQVAGAAVTEQELMDFVAARVLPYKKLRDVVFLEQLPVTATGKISKLALRTRL